LSRAEIAQAPEGTRHAVERRIEPGAGDAPVLDFAAALAQASGGVLGGAMTGVILHGSLTLGGYRPGRSDVDLLVIVDEPLSEERAAALAAAVGQVRPRAPVPADLRVAVRDVAAAPTQLPPLEAYLRFNDRGRPRVRVEGPHPGERDLVVEFSLCRAHGRSIVGPPPCDLIGAMPNEWVLEAGDAQLADWQAIGDDPPYAELTVLTACRLWRFAEEGRHCSKDAAGEWALSRDAELDVVRDALHRRCTDPTHPIDSAEVRDLLVLVRDRLARAHATKRELRD
jgi:hypothetical protein